MKWVLIRGLARSRPHWERFPEILASKTNDEVLCLDLPGVGTEAQTKSPLSIEEYADHLHKKFNEHIKPNESWGLIAISLGGMIGLKWVQKYPEDFKALVTMNTSAGNLCHPTERLSLAAIQTILKLFVSNDIAQRERAILSLTANLKEVNQELVDKWVMIDQQSPLKRATFIRQMIAATRFKVPNTLPFSPLILVSERDRLTSAVCSKKLAAHLGCGYIAHPQAGHDLPLDDPEWAVDQIANHFKF